MKDVREQGFKDWHLKEGVEQGYSIKVPDNTFLEQLFISIGTAVVLYKKNKNLIHSNSLQKVRILGPESQSSDTNTNFLPKKTPQYLPKVNIYQKKK